MAARAVRSFEDSARAAFREPDERDMTTSREWDHIDYWYDRHLEVNSPAARTANPSALALIAFAITTILLQGPSTQWTDKNTTYLAAPTMVVFGGVIQLCAGMWEFNRNNMFAGTALSSYGGFWISLGFYFIAVAGGLFPESGPKGLQMAFSLAGLFNFGYFLCACGLNVALIVLFFFLTTFNFLAAGGQNNTTCDQVSLFTTTVLLLSNEPDYRNTTHTEVGVPVHVSGYFGVAAGASGLYIAFAELFNETLFRGRVVVPLGAMTWPSRLHQARMKRQLAQEQQV